MDASYSVAVTFMPGGVARVEVWRSKTGVKVGDLDVAKLGDCMALGCLLASENLAAGRVSASDVLTSVDHERREVPDP